jgi:hypothetical protein
MLEESGYEDGYIAGSRKPIVLRNFMNTSAQPARASSAATKNPSVNNRRNQRWPKYRAR